MRQKHFSALAGGVALAIMMIRRSRAPPNRCCCWCRRRFAKPLRTRRFPLAHHALDHAAHGHIGRHHRRHARFARVAGETAPLLFTAFGNQYWNWKPDQPTAALSLQIFTYAISPFDEWHKQAWPVRWCDCADCGAVAAVRIAVKHGTWRELKDLWASESRSTPECLYGKTQALFDINIACSPTARRADWPVRLRQIHFHSLSQSHARDHSRGARRRQGPHRRHQRL